MLLFDCVFVLKIGILNFEIVSDFHRKVSSERNPLDCGVLRILIEKADLRY